MKKIVLHEDYYGRLLQVTITDAQPQHNVEFIPDSVKELVWEGMREDMNEDEFTYENTGETIIVGEEKKYATYSGSWRFLELDYKLMLRIAMWQGNFIPEESLSKPVFVQHFGENNGNHFYGKWIGECNRDFLKMIAYFRSNREHGQIFCNMLMEQVNKYTMRDKL